MKSYNRWSEDDLADMAHQRGLHVIKKKRGLQKKDYITALQQADRDINIPFMKLAPELRNKIYRHLLVFKESWTCHPQILATCTQVHQEATNIFYGDNWIDVKIYRDCVQAHGFECGEFNPDIRPDVTALRWPRFLRQAQWIRCSIVDLPARVVARAPFPTHEHAVTLVNQILYSLCSFLKGTRNLRSFHLDVQELRLGENDRDRAMLRTLQYPLTMLGEHQRIVVRAGGYNEILENSAINGIAHNGSALTPALRLSGMVVVYQIMVTHASDINGIARVRVGDKPMPVFIDQLNRQWTDLRNLMHYAQVFDADWERRMRAVMATLKRTLGFLGKDQVAAAHEDMIDALKVQLDDLRRM